MLRLPHAIGLGDFAHHDGLFAFWDSTHGIRYLGFAQGEVVANDMKEV